MRGRTLGGMLAATIGGALGIAAGCSLVPTTSTQGSPVPAGAASVIPPPTLTASESEVVALLPEGSVKIDRNGNVGSVIFTPEVGRPWPVEGLRMVVNFGLSGQKDKELTQPTPVLRLEASESYPVLSEDKVYTIRYAIAYGAKLLTARSLPINIPGTPATASTPVPVSSPTTGPTATPAASTSATPTLAPSATPSTTPAPSPTPTTPSTPVPLPSPTSTPAANSGQLSYNTGRTAIVVSGFNNVMLTAVGAFDRNQTAADVITGKAGVVPLLYPSLAVSTASGSAIVSGAATVSLLPGTNQQVLGVVMDGSLRAVFNQQASGSAAISFNSNKDPNADVIFSVNAGVGQIAP